MPKQVKYGKVALKAASDKLKRYCHVKDCEQIHRCPQQCMDCNLSEMDLHLDIDTALAWTTSMIIEDFFTNINDLNEELLEFWEKYYDVKNSEDVSDYKDELDDLQCQIRHVHHARELVSMSAAEMSACVQIIEYHREKYKKISYTIINADSMITTALVRAMEAFGQCKRTLIDCELKVVKMERNENPM